MADVLIRNVPDEVLARIRETAAERGETLQARLSRVLEEWAVHERRRVALARSLERAVARGGDPVTDEAHEALIDEMRSVVDVRWHGQADAR